MLPMVMPLPRSMVVLPLPAPLNVAVSPVPGTLTSLTQLIGLAHTGPAPPSHVSLAACADSPATASPRLKVRNLARQEWNLKLNDCLDFVFIGECALGVRFRAKIARSA